MTVELPVDSFEEGVYRPVTCPLGNFASNRCGIHSSLRWSVNYSTLRWEKHPFSTKACIFDRPTSDHFDTEINDAHLLSENVALLMCQGRHPSHRLVLFYWIRIQPANPKHASAVKRVFLTDVPHYSFRDLMDSKEQNVDVDLPSYFDISTHITLLAVAIAPFGRVRLLNAPHLLIHGHDGENRTIYRHGIDHHDRPYLQTLYILSKNQYSKLKLGAPL